MNQFLFKINNRNSICGFLKFICDIFFIIHFSLIRLDFTSIDEKLSRDIDISEREIRWWPRMTLNFFFLFENSSDGPVNYYLLSCYYLLILFIIS